MKMFENQKFINALMLTATILTIYTAFQIDAGLDRCEQYANTIHHIEKIYPLEK